MIVCANCGTSNEPGARYCQECGADLRTLGRAGEQIGQAASFEPLQPPFAFESVPSGQPKRSRTWLWIIVGGLGGCVLLCCIFFAWGSTVGQDEFERLGTWAARQQDELNETDTPAPPARPTREPNATVPTRTPTAARTPTLPASPTRASTPSPTNTILVPAFSRPTSTTTPTP